MEILKKFLYAIAALGLIGLAVIAAAFQEIGAALSGVFVQTGVCKEDDSLCLLSYWGLVVFVIFLFAILLDLFARRQTKLFGTESTKESDIIEQSKKNELQGSSELDLEPVQFEILNIISEHSEHGISLDLLRHMQSTVTDDNIFTYHLETLLELKYIQQRDGLFFLDKGGRAYLYRKSRQD